VAIKEALHLDVRAKDDLRPHGDNKVNRSLVPVMQG
jgi:hypothetical protein